MCNILNICVEVFPQGSDGFPCPEPGILKPRSLLSYSYGQLCCGKMYCELYHPLLVRVFTCTQGLLALQPAYATTRHTHYCHSCSSHFTFSLAPATAPSTPRSRMSLREVYTEGPVPPCPSCSSPATVVRLLLNRPPHTPPILALRGGGAGKGLSALAQVR